MRVEIGDFAQDDESERIINVQVDEWDTWNMDQTIALMVLPLIKKYKEEMESRGMCFPGSLYSQVRESYNPDQNEILSEEELEELVRDTCGNLWNEYVEAMIFSFEEAIEGYTGTFDTKEYQKYQQKIQDGFELFGKYFTSLWT